VYHERIRSSRRRRHRLHSLVRPLSGLEISASRHRTAPVWHRTEWKTSFSLVPPQPWPPWSRVLELGRRRGTGSRTGESSISATLAADAHAASRRCSRRVRPRSRRVYKAVAKRERRTTTVIVSPQAASSRSAMAYAARAERRAARCHGAFNLALPDERVGTGFDTSISSSRAAAGVRNSGREALPPLGRHFDLGSSATSIRSPVPRHAPRSTTGRGHERSSTSRTNPDGAKNAINE